MSPFWTAVTLFLGFLCFVFAAIGVASPRWFAWLPAGLALWILVPLWTAVAAVN